jgi:hypothetical protein
MTYLLVQLAVNLIIQFQIKIPEKVQLLTPDYYIIGGATIFEIYLFFIARKYVKICIEQLKDDEDFAKS